MNNTSDNVNCTDYAYRENFKHITKMLSWSVLKLNFQSFIGIKYETLQFSVWPIKFC